MENQLGFTYEDQPYTPYIASQPPIYIAQEEFYQLPDQLNFSSAQAPILLQEKPQPLFHSNLPEHELQPKPLPKAQGRLVQFQIAPKQKLPAKKSKRPPAKKHTFKAPPQKKAQSALPEWNSNTVTAGVFDAKITKKVPITLQHAIKNARTQSTGHQRPINTFEDLQQSYSPQAGQKGSPGKRQQVQQMIKLAENLEPKFIQDQEQVIWLLERQLQQEKEARKELDKNFNVRMKELEHYKKLDKHVEHAKNQFLRAKQQIDHHNAIKQQARPSSAKRPAAAVLQRPTSVKQNSSAASIQHSIRNPSPSKMQYVGKEQLEEQFQHVQEYVEQDDIQLQRNRSEGNIDLRPTRDVNTETQLRQEKYSPYQQEFKPIQPQRQQAKALTYGHSQEIVHGKGPIPGPPKNNQPRSQTGTNQGIQYPRKEQKAQAPTVLQRPSSQSSKPAPSQIRTQQRSNTQTSQLRDLPIKTQAKQEQIQAQTIEIALPQQNINQALSSTAFQVTDIREKLDPLLNTLTNTVRKLDVYSKYGANHMIGMVSKVSANYIAYYSDQLTHLLLEDLLEDTVEELGKIERMAKYRSEQEFIVETQQNIKQLAMEFSTLEPDLARHIAPKAEKSNVVQQSEPIVIEDSPLYWKIDLEN